MSMTNIGMNIANLTDMGIDLESENTGAEVSTERTYKSTLVKGSIEAKALYAFYSNAPVTVIKSPPGGGKSTLIAQLVRQFHVRDQFTIAIAVPTRLAARELAIRVHQELGGEMNVGTGNLESKVRWAIGSQEERPDELASVVSGTNISIHTVAQCLNNPPECDVMIVDEAWQTVHADIASAADAADQLILVGDSGQIGPIIDFDCSQFTGNMAPHLPAPEVFSRKDKAVTLSISSTYRLGAATVDVIAPLYDFEFDSKRPNRSLIHPKLGHLSELETIQFDQVDKPDDAALLKSVYDRAVSYIGSVVEQDGAENIELTDADIAVIAAHNVQASKLKIMFSNAGYDNVLVGTADKLQGSQRHAVVSLDPLAGQEAASDHHVSAGRTCVMLSRHMTHLTWFYPNNWRELLETSELEDAKGSIAVRERLFEVDGS